MKPVPRLLTLCLLASFFWAPLSAQVSGVDYVITRTQLDTAGQKLRRTVNSGGIIETTDYAGNAIYDGFSLAMLQIPGGYVTLSGTTPTYHYYLHYYPSLSPYTYCANSPANIVDPNGMDWYINNENGYYTWFDGNEDKEGYTYFGGKGSLLGEAEYIIDYLNTNYGSNTSIFSSGFTFCIRSNDVRSISGGENGFGLLEEFINNSGPEFSVFLEGHPFTKEMMKTAFVKNLIKRILNSKKDYINHCRNWRLFDVFFTSSEAEQFIGSYRFLSLKSRVDKCLYSVIYDSKSITSLFYHLPGLKNLRRGETEKYGNTYQFYLWKTPLKK